MRSKSLIIGLLLVGFAVACGGGGGSDGEDGFNFNGLWLASFGLISNTCELDISPGGSELFEIMQNNEVVNVSFADDDRSLVFQGVADGGDFTAFLGENSLFTCDDGSPLQNATVSLEFMDSQGDSADPVLLNVVGDCPDQPMSCEIIYNGVAVRVSGPGSASGEEVFTSQSLMDVDPAATPLF